MLQLKNVKYPVINSRINIPTNKTVTIESGFSVQVRYNEEEKRMMSVLEVNCTCNEHPEWFNIVIQVMGVFVCDDLDTEEKKKNAHIESYKELFPFVQSVILELTTKAGVKSFFLEKEKIDASQVEISEH